MRTTNTLPTLLVLVAVAGCRGDGELAPPEYSLGREIIETFAEYVGEDPSDIRVRSGALDGLRRAGAVDHPGYADIRDIAEAIGKYVRKAGISFPALPEGGPRVVPGVINAFGSMAWLKRFTIHFAYGTNRSGDRGGRLPCSYGMVVERLGNGEWYVGTPEVLETYSGSLPSACPHSGVLP